MKTYHIGLIKGSGKCFPLHRNGYSKDTVIIQARENIDLLSCQLWQYYGERETTKARLVGLKNEILKAINKEYNTSFKFCVID